MKSIKYLILIVIFLPGLLNAEHSDNKKCLRCHSMATFGIRDTLSLLVKNLSVNPVEFDSSNHKRLICTKCHSKDFDNFPHPQELKSENLYCLNCHRDDEKLVKFRFPDIEKEFKESVHFKKLKDKFTCFNCHDPHSFKINSRVKENLKEAVLYDNQICLECHNYADKIEGLSGRILPSLSVTHNWLPHQKLHWESVRCIDCHILQNVSGVSHLILEKKDAVKNCVKCHSKDSMLRQSLYKFQAKEERNKIGFLNATILNDSYIIGATRNIYLDVISFIAFGLTIIGISIHGFLRWFIKRKINKKGDKE